MKPDARKHNPSPEYIRALCKGTGLSMYKLSALVGVKRSSLYRYMTGETEIPYSLQYALERLQIKKPPGGGFCESPAVADVHGAD